MQSKKSDSLEVLRTIDPGRKTTIPAAHKELVGQTNAELTAYCTRVRSEVLSFADEATTALSGEDRKAIHQMASDQFEPALYPNRFDLFGEAIERDLSRRGVRIDLSVFRLDLPKASHSAGTTNGISRSLASLRDDLELLNLRKQRAAIEETMAPQAAHWTSTWGFWIGAVGVIAGIAGAYRAFVPSDATQATKTKEQIVEEPTSLAASPKPALKTSGENPPPAGSLSSK